MAATDTLQKRFGARCRELRKKRELSQLDMVRNFDFGLSHYQKIERGVLDIRLATIEKLAACFNVSVSELFKGL